MSKKLFSNFFALAASTTLLLAEEPKSAADAANTDRNRADRSGETVTPFDQSNATADLQVSADIRKAIMADDSLTTTAKNVKVITGKKTITLRGPVTSIAEKSTIDTLARKRAGNMRVDSRLELVLDK